jgi:hypothetical protein
MTQNSVLAEIQLPSIRFIAADTRRGTFRASFSILISMIFARREGQSACVINSSKVSNFEQIAIWL